MNLPRSTKYFGSSIQTAEKLPKLCVSMKPHQLVDLAHAKVTPESAVLVPEHVGAEALRTVDRGRSDDRYVQIGQERACATAGCPFEAAVRFGRLNLRAASLLA
jgi:hypothetical protein